MINSKKYSIRLFFLTVVYWSCTINIFCQVSAQISIPFNVYDNAGGQKILQFGLDQTATESIDIHLGESDLPPYPPSGAFDARFLLPENNFSGSLSSILDYRFAAAFPFSGAIEHRLRYQSAEGATIMYLGWDFPSEVTGLLQDLVGGVIVNVPISGTGVYELTNFTGINQLKLFIYYDNVVTGIDDDINNPAGFYLEQNYPNPFNPETIIKFSIAEESHVNLSIFNMLGELITELKNEMMLTGKYEIIFNSANLTSGIYLYRITAGDFISTKKMILLR